MEITLEFSGGAELLFDKKKELKVSLPSSSFTIKSLLPWITSNCLKERPELFLQGTITFGHPSEHKSFKIRKFPNPAILSSLS